MVHTHGRIQLLKRNFELGVNYGIIVLGVILLLLGWFVLFVWIPTDNTGIWQSMIIWTQITSIQILIGCMLMGTVFLVMGLIRGFTKIGQNKTGWLVLPIIGIYVMIASILYITWGIQMHLLNIPLLIEGGGQADVLETIRKVIMFPSIIAIFAGIGLISLGTYKYLQNNA